MAVADLPVTAARARRIGDCGAGRVPKPPLPAGEALARLQERLRRPSGVGRLERLSLVMSLLFIGLSIPILIFILIYNYNKNSAGMVSILETMRSRRLAGPVTIEACTENLIE